MVTAIDAGLSLGRELSVCCVSMLLLECRVTNKRADYMPEISRSTLLIFNGTREVPGYFGKPSI